MKIGILGGGQLARMLAHESAKLKLTIHVLSPNADDPAAQVSGVHWTQGSPDNAIDLRAFLTGVDVVTFESEFVSPELVREASTGLKVKIRPSLKALSTLRERSTQKQALVKSGIATSPFISPVSAAELVSFFDSAKRGIVLKKKLFGYDGFGTFIIRERAELDLFLREHSVIDFIAEERVVFRRELAVSLARDVKGNIVFLPIVEWKARRNQCWWVKGPVISSRAQKLKKDLKKLAADLDYCGLLTFELFETSSGLLVNEVAPRVHNSAHHSIDSMALNQFQAHLIAMSGGSLKGGTVRKPFAMVNLVGEKNGVARAPVPSAKAKGSFLHWYGKTESRPGRKMGHVTVLANSADAALKRALTLEKTYSKSVLKPT